MNKKTLMLYYPYGVRVVAGPYYKESFRVVDLKEKTYIVVSCWEEKKPIEIDYGSRLYQPALYPFAALTLPMWVNGKEIIPLELLCKIVFEDANILSSGSTSGWFRDSLHTYFINNGCCPFSRDLMNRIYYILQALHFDISNSIRQREAKNILKSGYNPYVIDRIVLP